MSVYFFVDIFRRFFIFLTLYVHLVRKRTLNHLAKLSSSCGFESSCSHLNFRFRACFEQGVPWHSGNYRVWIRSETRTWHEKNIQSVCSFSFKSELKIKIFLILLRFNAVNKLTMLSSVVLNELSFDIFAPFGSFGSDLSEKFKVLQLSWNSV